MRLLVVLTALTLAQSADGRQPAGQPAQLSAAWYEQFQGPYSVAVVPFKIVGNIYYVGAANIASYLITTPEGHILIDTGTKKMHEVIRRSVAELGFEVSDIKVVLASHAHFDHVAGHAAMKQLTGAQVVAMVGDAEALESGTDNSALGAVGWDPVSVDRVLKHGDTVSLGGTTLRAIHAAGHTPGATTWMATVRERGPHGREYTVAFHGGTTPNAGVPLAGNPRHPHVIEDTRRTFQRLKAEKVPDIYLPSHPEAMFAGKVDRLRAGERPHPLLNGAAWVKMIADAEAAFDKRVAEERP
jgi:metallo-beta-lactamase class B